MQWFSIWFASVIGKHTIGIPTENIFWQKVFVFFGENMYVDMQTNGQADVGWPKDWEIDKNQTETNKASGSDTEDWASWGIDGTGRWLRGC